MKFQLLGARRRLLGGWTLGLEALESGLLSRKRTGSRNLIGDPVLLLERASIAKGQRLRWRVDDRPYAQRGAMIDSDTLPDHPGPHRIRWSVTPLL